MMFIRYLISLYLWSGLVSAMSPHFRRRTKMLERIDPPSNVDRSDPSSDGINYETLGGGFEGDMIFHNGINPSKTFKGKGAAVSASYRWPNNVIPYDISEITSPSDRNTIEQAMQTLMYVVGTPIPGSTTRRNCVTFRAKESTDKYYIKIGYGDGCSANVGYTPQRPMTLKLKKGGCFHSGIIEHELMHVLGFFHEQSRADRDNYVTIDYANIQSDFVHNFKKYQWGNPLLNQDTPYDYQSLMHYGTKYFSSNGQPTITPKQSDATIGQREKLSNIDIVEIRAYYSC